MNLNFENIPLGFQINKDPSIATTFDEAPDLKGYQIFISNGRSYEPPKVDIGDLIRARSLLERRGKYLCIHGSLLYNLAGATQIGNPNFYRNLSLTCRSLVTELDVGVMLGCGVVVHTGSSERREFGLEKIPETISSLLEMESDHTRKVSLALGIPVSEVKRRRKIILENSAGEGNKLGKSIEEISEIIQRVDTPLQSQVKVCIDTAHLFAAGDYDLGSPLGVVQFMWDFDRMVGVEKLELFHLNDSKIPCGGKCDRHENLGRGHQWGTDERRKGFQELMEQSVYYQIPLIGEPPKGKESMLWDINFVKELYPVSEDHIC